MIILISGSSHTGKTLLAQHLVEKYKYFCLSIDHIKMGLIRSGVCPLSPENSDDELTPYLWNIVKEIIKTAIENKQNLIIEGCYIPFDFMDHFGSDYKPYIKYICIIFSENYIRKNFALIKDKANVIEKRLDDSYCTNELLIQENKFNLKMCKKHNLNYVLIENDYISDLKKYTNNI